MRTGRALGDRPTTIREACGVLSPQHAAAWLDLGLTATYALMRDGELPFIRIGRHRRIKVADLEAFIERQSALLDPANSNGVGVAL